jgi:hypothetical protein
MSREDREQVPFEAVTRSLTSLAPIAPETIMEAERGGQRAVRVDVQELTTASSVLVLPRSMLVFASSAPRRRTTEPSRTTSVSRHSRRTGVGSSLCVPSETKKSKGSGARSKRMSSRAFIALAANGAAQATPVVAGSCASMPNRAAA